MQMTTIPAKYGQALWLFLKWNKNTWNINQMQLLKIIQPPSF